MYCIRLSKQVYQRTRICFLYDAHKSTNPEFSYWNFERLDLDEETNECMADFGFYTEGIYELAEQMQQPDEIITNNSLVVASVPV